MVAASNVIESIIVGLLQIRWWPTMSCAVVAALVLMHHDGANLWTSLAR